MTKYCRAPNCSNSAGQPRPDKRRLSFYKFPLQNPARLQQWLSQMNQEKWLPTKHQHLCSEHFAPSCFEYRWGVRYLKPDAIPTIFQKPHGPLKRENSAKHPSEVPVKRFLLECQAERTMPGPQAVVIHQEPNAFKTLAFTVEPAVSTTPIYVGTQSAASGLDLPTLSGPLVGAVNLVPLVQIMEPVKAMTLTLTSPTEAIPGQPFSDAGEQQVLNFVASLPPPTLEAVPNSSLGVSGQFSPEVAMPCKVVAAATTDQPPLQALLTGHPAAAEQGALVIENVSIEPFWEAESSTAAVLSSIKEEEEELSTEMVAYFETIPTPPLAATAASSNGTPPETVLSSALSLPIVSTVPIISTQASPEASPAEQEEEEEEEEEEEKLEELSSAESLEEQLEEHRYHKNEEGTKANLVEVVMGLQKKVKVLQQRHRRHCAKLEAMEGAVEQLRKENLVSEEKLKLLEMACLQPSAIIREGDSTVAIICQESDQAVVYAVPQISEEGNGTIIHWKSRSPRRTEEGEGEGDQLFLPCHPREEEESVPSVWAPTEPQEEATAPPLS